MKVQQEAAKQKERRRELVQLAGFAMQGFIQREQPQRLPHEILVDNLAREAVRFASRTIEELDKQAAQG